MVVETTTSKRRGGARIERRNSKKNRLPPLFSRSLSLCELFWPFLSLSFEERDQRLLSLVEQRDIRSPKDTNQRGR